MLSAADLPNDNNACTTDTCELVTGVVIHTPIALDDGNVITEVAAVLQYVADQAPQSQLAPPPGSLERVRLQEWLNFIATEVHKGFSPLFNPATPEEYKPAVKAKLVDRYKWLDSQLEGKSYLLGDDFSVADGYLFTVTNWAKHTGVDLSPFKNLGAFMARVAARPAVQEALKAEGLLK